MRLCPRPSRSLLPATWPWPRPIFSLEWFIRCIHCFTFGMNLFAWLSFGCRLFGGNGAPPFDERANVVARGLFDANPQSPGVPRIVGDGNSSGPATSLSDDRRLFRHRSV